MVHLLKVVRTLDCDPDVFTALASQEFLLRDAKVQAKSSSASERTFFISSRNQPELLLLEPADKESSSVR